MPRDQWLLPACPVLQRDGGGIRQFAKEGKVKHEIILPRVGGLTLLTLRKNRLILRPAHFEDPYQTWPSTPEQKCNILPGGLTVLLISTPSAQR